MDNFTVIYKILKALERAGVPVGEYADEESCKYRKRT